MARMRFWGKGINKESVPKLPYLLCISINTSISFPPLYLCSFRISFSIGFLENGAHQWMAGIYGTTEINV